MKKLILLLICVVFFGCSHDVTVKTAVSPVAYQFVDQQFDGNVAIFVHPDIAKLNEVVKPRSRRCSSWSFPLEAGHSIKASLIKTAQGVFKNCKPVDFVTEDHKFDGILAAELLDFDVDLTFITGLWNGSAESFVELNIKLTFYDSNLKPVWRSVVGYTKKDFSDAGGSCDEGATAISGCIEQCMKNITIQMAEKITSSEKIKATIAQARHSS